MLKKVIVRGMVALAATSALVAGAATSAAAAPAHVHVAPRVSHSGCSVHFPWHPSCWTSVVRANADFHYIDYDVCAWADPAKWQVIDWNLNRVVRSGYLLPFQCKGGRISGLYGNYRGKITGPPLSRIDIFS
jgi:hypothetical protein